VLTAESEEIVCSVPQVVIVTGADHVVEVESLYSRKYEVVPSKYPNSSGSKQVRVILTWLAVIEVASGTIAGAVVGTYWYLIVLPKP